MVTEIHTQLFSPAKLNLGLQVLQRLPDGYHEIHSVLVPLEFGDLLFVDFAPSGDLHIAVTFRSEAVAIPLEENLIYKAAKLFADAVGQSFTLRVQVQKRIPIGGGLGGGSSNAASILKFLNAQFDFPLTKQQLKSLGQQLGSDIPFFLEAYPGSIAEVSGKGEKIQVYTWEFPYFFVLLLPDYSISTEWAYQNLQLQQRTEPIDFFYWLRGYWDCEKILRKYIVNDFESLLFDSYPDLQMRKEKLLAYGALFAGVSGTGSTVYGCFASESDAQEALQKLSEDAQFLHDQRVITRQRTKVALSV